MTRQAISPLFAISTFEKSGFSAGEGSASAAAGAVANAARGRPAANLRPRRRPAGFSRCRASMLVPPLLLPAFVPPVRERSPRTLLACLVF